MSFKGLTVQVSHIYIYIYIYIGCGGRNDIFRSLKNVSHIGGHNSCCSSGVCHFRKKHKRLFKFPNITAIKNKYFMWNDYGFSFCVGIVLRHRYDLIWWSNLLEKKFYYFTSFCLPRAVKAKIYEKPHKLWTKGHINESSLQVVYLQLKHKWNTSCRGQNGCSIEIVSRRLDNLFVPNNTLCGEVL